MMPLVLADRVKETTTTTGTGTITLLGAATGFSSFAVIGNGNTTYYCIAGQGTNEWEVGVGTYTSSGTTLSRDTVLASSAGAPTKTNFSGGTKDVFVTYTAARSVNVDGTSVDTFGLGAAQGDILYASGTDNFVLLNKNTTATRYLANTGTTNNPQWDQINLSNGVTNTLPVGNGGTGQSSLTANNVILGNGTSGVQFVAPGTTGNVLTSNGTTWQSTAPSGIPSGTVVWFAASTAPTGYLKANGASLSTTTYAALFAAIGYTFGGSGGNFSVPDLRGEFIRGWDDGRGVDSGRVFGSSQLDQMQRLTGLGNAFWAHLTGPSGSGVFAGTGTGTSGRISTAVASGTTVSFDSANSSGARTGTETRARNIALLACIKF